MPFLKTAGLEQRTGDKVLLKNINLEIEKGEIFVLIGPTGSGKTTLIRMLDLLDSPFAGDIFLDGVQITGPSVDTVMARRRLAMVFQKPAVFNESVFENIAYPLKLRGVAKDQINPKVMELLETTGLRGFAARKARTLSGGEAQRVALARAMATNPEVLLLDEPTANLDPQSVQIIEDLIIKFNRTYNVTIVMSTHDMLQGQRLADRAGVLMSGELVQVGNTSDIFQSPTSTKVAGFIGIKNILHGQIESHEKGLAVIKVEGKHIEAVCDLADGSAVDLYIRPEDIVLSAQMPSGSARNILNCVIKSTHLAGSLSYVALDDCGLHLEALITSRSADEMGLQKGQSIYASFKATSVKVLKGA